MVHFLFCQTFLSLEMSRGWDERTQTHQAEEQIMPCRSAGELCKGQSGDMALISHPVHTATESVILGLL